MSYTQRVSLYWTTSSLAVTRRVVAIAVGLSLFLVCGCTTIGFVVPAANAAVGLSGTLHGGKQSIAGATVQIYAVGTTGDGSPATPLLAAPAKTNDLGAFTLGKYTCPSPTSQIYLAATGGNPGLAPNSTNPQSTEMAALGTCGELDSSDTVEINEITTVAAAYALAPFMKSASAVGSGPEDAPALATAFSSAASLANSANGTTPGINAPADIVVPSEKISTLANILSTCINSSGGMVGSSSPCGQLFSLTLSNNGKVSTDTAEALVNLANNPTENVRAIFDLSPAVGPFQPGLAAAPADWKVEVTAAPAAPSFSPKPGYYSAATSVTLASPETSAVIYYTTDGSQPSTSSTRYTGAFTVSLTTTIRAVAVVASVSSVVASATYTLPAEKLVFRTQPTSGLAGAVISPSPSVAIENLAGAVNSAASGPITIQIGSNPGSGTLSGTTTVNAFKGIATFPALIIDLQGDGYSLTAHASGLSAVTSNLFNRTNSVTLSLPATGPAAGTSGTASFTLKAPAPGGGLLATLQSSNESVATVKPTSIAIPAGATKGTFEYQGVAPGSATLTINVPGTPAASATAKIMPAVSVSLTPAIVKLYAAQTQHFTASVANSSNTAVTWTLSPSVGSISAVGLYTAPATISAAQIVTVKATSVADTTKSATATISLTPPVSVSLTPGSVTLSQSKTQSFTASVANSSNTAVTWTLSPSVGSISAAGLYTAPATIATAQTVTVKATSLADSTKFATATVSLAPPVSVSLNPVSVTLSQSQTQVFKASVLNSSNTAVTWTLSPSVGSISAAGLYTAPAAIASAQTVTVKATSVADSTKTATATISLTPPVSVSLNPVSLTLGQSQTQAFAATVANTSNTTVTWTLSPAVGTISAAALYTAPTTIAAVQTITVTATSVADSTKSAIATISLTPPVGVSLTPATVTLGQSQSQAFAATVANSSNSTVTWTLSPAVGSISAAGLYTAPSTIAAAQTVTVKATSVADSTKSAIATVALGPSIPASLFGMTVLNFDYLSPSMQFGTTRSWDAYPGLDWSDINPAAGVYNFTSLDQFIAINQARGSDIIYTFGRTPQWASSQPNAPTPYGPGECAPPTDMRVWNSYVTAIVTHAAGRIKNWELWNEPNSSTFYCGDIPTMVIMAQDAAKIIKSIDPTALVLSPAAVGGPGPAWLGSFLSSGGAAAVDVIAFHGYWSAQAEDVLGVISNFSTAASGNGAAGKRLWDTESSWAGFGTLPTLTSEQQVSFIAKDYLLHLSQGISRFVWYAYDGGSIWGGLLTSAGTESPAATSYKQTYRWMVGATLASSCSEAANQVWTCGLSRSSGYASEAVWISNQTANFTVPSKYVEYRDLAGVVHPITTTTISIGDQPILLETGPLP